MNEEMKYELGEVIAEEGTEVTEAMVETVDSDGGAIVKAIVAIGTLVVAGITLYKNKDKLAEKIDERRIRKLEKKGYIIGKAVVSDEDDKAEEEDSE